MHSKISRSVKYYGILLKENDLKLFIFIISLNIHRQLSLNFFNLINIFNTLETDNTPLCHLRLKSAKEKKQILETLKRWLLNHEQLVKNHSSVKG